MQFIPDSVRQAFGFAKQAVVAAKEAVVPGPDLYAPPANANGTATPKRGSKAAAEAAVDTVEAVRLKSVQPLSVTTYALRLNGKGALTDIFTRLSAGQAQWSDMLMSSLAAKRLTERGTVVTRHGDTWQIWVKAQGEEPAGAIVVKLEEDISNPPARCRTIVSTKSRAEVLELAHQIAACICESFAT